jgi:GDP/UDP-N,N'-diacetylbacillosamine 2-epimerase (hydrolysing)
MKRFKISIFTVARSDLSIMKNIIQNSEIDKKFVPQLVIGSAHNSKVFGKTKNEVEKLKIKKKYYYNFNYKESSAGNVLKYFSQTIDETNKYFLKNKPECALLIGDRYEMLAIAICCLNHNIPIAHFCGGSETLGSLDDKYRISISKMANFHFVETKFHKNNLIKNNIKENLFIVGAPALEELKRKKISLNIIKNNFNMDLNLNKKIIMVCFHSETTKPITQNIKNLKKLINSILKINENIIFTFPNADAGFPKYIEIINKKLSNKKNINLVKNLGINNYYSLLEKSDMLIGNSSSGIIESASFDIPVINLGDRQKKRYAPSNVHHCAFDVKKIIDTYNKLIKKRKMKYSNPYFKKDCSKKVLKILYNLLLKI